MAEERRQASVHYEENAEKRTFPVSGAYGGASGPGHYVAMHVFAEWGMIPSLEQHEEGGGPPKLIKRGDVHREVQASMMMSPEVAISLGKWLIGKGLEARRIRDQHGSKDIQDVLDQNPPSGGVDE